MVNTKRNMEKKAHIITKVLIADTLKTIPSGETAHFTRRELSNSDNAVQSAASRLNKKSGAKEFSVRIDEGDGSFYITRSNIKAV